MANEITPPGTARPLRTSRIKSATDKQKEIPVPEKKSKTERTKNADDDGQIHIDEYI